MSLQREPNLTNQVGSLGFALQTAVVSVRITRRSRVGSDKFPRVVAFSGWISAQGELRSDEAIRTNQLMDRSPLDDDATARCHQVERGSVEPQRRKHSSSLMGMERDIGEAFQAIPGVA